MLSHSLKFRKNTKSKNPKVVKTKTGRTMLLSNTVVFDSKKSKFIKEHQASEILGNLLGTKIPILGDLSLTNILF